MIFTGIAYAQEGSHPQPQATMFDFLIPILIIFAVFYFVVFRPQQRKMKEHKAFLDNLKPGDDVITTGGIYGKVVNIAENIIMLEIAKDVRIKVDKTAISGAATEKKKQN
jgi:preprotein translocase subunit YajC